MVAALLCYDPAVPAECRPTDGPARLLAMRGEEERVLWARQHRFTGAVRALEYSLDPSRRQETRHRPDASKKRWLEPVGFFGDRRGSTVIAAEASQRPT